MKRVMLQAHLARWRLWKGFQRGGVHAQECPLEGSGDRSWNQDKNGGSFC